MSFRTRIQTPRSDPLKWWTTDRARAVQQPISHCRNVTETA